MILYSCSRFLRTQSCLGEFLWASSGMSFWDSVVEDGSLWAEFRVLVYCLNSEELTTVGPIFFEFFESHSDKNIQGWLLWAWPLYLTHITFSSGLFLHHPGHSVATIVSLRSPRHLEQRTNGIYCHCCNCFWMEVLRDGTAVINICCMVKGTFLLQGYAQWVPQAWLVIHHTNLFFLSVEDGLCFWQILDILGSSR